MASSIVNTRDQDAVQKSYLDRQSLQLSRVGNRLRSQQENPLDNLHRYPLDNQLHSPLVNRLANHLDSQLWNLRVSLQ